MASLFIIGLFIALFPEKLADHFGLQKVDPPFDGQPLCQRLNVWPMLRHELACLADHFVDEVEA